MILHSSHGYLWSKLRRVILTPKSGKGTGMVEKARELAAEHGWLLCHQFLGVKHATSCVDMWRMCKLCATCWEGHWAAGSPWIDHRTDSHGICFYLVRFETPANAKIHYDTTGQEILNDFEGTGQIFKRPPGRHISLYRVRMLGQRYAAACISDRSRHPPGLLCHRLWNWRNLRWCWESSSGGEPSRLRASLMWQPGRLTSHDSHAEHEARIRWIRWIRQPVLKKTPCSTNHLKLAPQIPWNISKFAQEKRPEVKLCLAEPADAPLVASGHKMDRPRVATGWNSTLLQRIYHFSRRCELMIDHLSAHLCS